jgi:hypothetical protein
MRQLKVVVVRSVELVAEAWDSSGTQRKGDRPPLAAAAKQRLIKTENFMCTVAAHSLEFVPHSDCRSYL